MKWQALSLEVVNTKELSIEPVAIRHGVSLLNAQEQAYSS